MSRRQPISNSPTSQHLLSNNLESDSMLNDPNQQDLSNNQDQNLSPNQFKSPSSRERTQTPEKKMIRIPKKKIVPYSEQLETEAMEILQPDTTKQESLRRKEEEDDDNDDESREESYANNVTMTGLEDGVFLNEVKTVKMISNLPKFPIQKNLEKEKDSFNKQGSELSKIAILKRRLARIVFLIVYISLIITGIALWFNSNIDTGTFVLSESHNIAFRMDNCTLMIKDNVDKTKDPLYFEYYLAKGSSASRSLVVFNRPSQRLDILNEFDSIYCKVDLYVRKGVVIQSMHVSCKGCNITQDTSFQLQINGSLNMSGRQVEANFRNLQVSSLNYDANTGYLQLNNIDSLNTSTIIMKVEGDIVVQSTKDFQMDVVTDTEAYCLNAPFIGATYKNDKCLTTVQTIATNNTSSYNNDWSSTYNNEVPSEYYCDEDGNCYSYSEESSSAGSGSGGSSAASSSQSTSDTGLNYAEFSSGGFYDESYSNGSCRVVHYLCQYQNCTSSNLSSYFKIKSNKGTVYGNIIPEVGRPIPQQRSLNSTQGAAYLNQNLIFDSGLEKAIETFNNLSSVQSNGNIFTILNIGSIGSRSSRLSRWILSSAPPYSLLKPWWIGTISATLLTTKNHMSTGHLLPGVCPFTPTYTLDDLVTIQTKLASKAKSQLTTFVHEEGLSLPTRFNTLNRGVFDFSQENGLTDKWISLSVMDDGTISLENNDLTQKGGILGAVILSVIIAVLSSCFLLELVISSINTMYYKLVDLTCHLEKYKTEHSKRSNYFYKPKKMTESIDDLQERKYNIINLLKIVPSPACFLEYLSLIISRQSTDSVGRFYELLFREVKSLHEGVLDSRRETITGTQVKLLYEKFCFVNHLTEQRLSDETNIKILDKYGFEIQTPEELPLEMFKKIYIKSHDKFRVNILPEEESLNSLDLYMQRNVEVTEFEEDEIEVKEFVKIYNEFCDFNDLDRVNVTPSYMAEKYQVPLFSVPQKLIARQTDEGKVIRLDFFTRIRRKIMGFFGSKEKKVYVIDTSKLEQNFKLTMREFSTSHKDYSSASKELILTKSWWLWDMITVLSHLLLIAVFTIPLFALAILNQTQYSLWSLKEPTRLITASDLQINPGLVFKNLYTSAFFWNQAIMSIASVLWCIAFVDLIFYYLTMSFPQDEAFTKIKDKGEFLFKKLLRRLQWILFLLILFIYIAYGVLVSVWLLMGAFINPDAFLPSATASLTFITFLVTKYKAFKDTANEGMETIKGHLTEIFDGLSVKYLGKIVQKLEKLSEQATGQVSMIKSDAFVAEASKLVGTGIIDNKTFLQFKEKVNLNKDSEEAEPGAVNNVIVGFGQMIKEKTIEKVKEEGAKRLIPGIIVDLKMSMALKDDDQVEKVFREIVSNVADKKKISPEEGEIISGLFFPAKFKNEENMMFLTSKIFKPIFKKLNSKVAVNGLNSDILLQIFTNFQNLRNSKIKLFTSGIKELLNNLNDKHSPKQIKLLVQTMDLVSFLREDDQDFSKSKDYCLDYLSTIMDLVSPNDVEAMFNKDFLRLLETIISKNELIYDINTKDPLRPSDILKLVKKLFEGIPNEIVVKDVSGALTIKNIVPNLVYLALSYGKDDINDLPKEVIRDLNEVLGTQNKKDFTQLLFNLANTGFNHHIHIYQSLNQAILDSGLEQELQEFCRLVACYSISDDMCTVLNIQLELGKNKYFAKIASFLKMEPGELLGLLNILYKKKNSKQAYVFFKGLLKKFGLKPEDLKEFRPVISLLFSDEETSVLRGAKALNLKLRNFLLISKGILNPKYISIEEFEEVWIRNPQLLKEKDIIFETDSNIYEMWKSRLIENIKENLEQEINQNGEDVKIEKRKKILTHVMTCLENWRTSLSRRDLATLINNITSCDHNISDKVYSQEGLEFLECIFMLKHFQLQEGRRMNNLSKQKEHTITQLSEILRVNIETLKALFRIFLVNDNRDLTEDLSYFFSEESDNIETIKKVLDYSFKQVSKLQDQVQFAQETLPNYLQSNQNVKTNITRGLSKLFTFGPKINLTINEILDPIAIEMSKVGFNPVESSLINVYKFALTAKGLIPEEEAIKLFKIKNKEMITLFRAFTKSGRADRINTLSEILLEDDNPLKIQLALYAFCKNSDCKIKCFLQGSKKVDRDLKTYLAFIFGVHPEIFDLFEVTFNCNGPEFYRKALSAIRKFQKAFKDEALMETLFLLSLGDNYNVDYLSTKLSISSDTLEFFMIIRRLATKRTRTEGFKELLQPSAFRRVLSRLNIEASEFISLLRMIFNYLNNEVVLNEVLTDLGEIEAIDISLLKKLLKFDESLLDPKVNLLKGNKLKKIEDLLQSFDYDEEIRSDALDILSLAAGNYLIIKDNKVFDWAFPNSDFKSNQHVRNMTMALCGLLNSNLEVSPNLHKEINEFISHSQPQVPVFTEGEQTTTQKVLANNSLAYASYLAQTEMDIPCCWAQAFLFDENIYNMIGPDNASRINKEFVLTVVLNFINLPDYVGDYLGLHEWFVESQKFFLKDNKSIKIKKPHLVDIFDIFSEKITFQFEKVRELARQFGLLEKTYWANIFSKQSTFNRMINKAILLILGDPELVKTFNQIKRESPHILLDDIVRYRMNRKNYSELSRKQALGKLIKKLILGCYKILTLKSSQEQRQEDYRLTNLSILSTMVKLRRRVDLKMTFDRVLYNLHQMVTNVERKLYLDENFWKMSKFSVLKLAGVSMGVQISNIVQWCLPPSLFPYGFVKQLQEANYSREVCDRIKLEKSRLVLDDQSSSEKIGDLGVLGGSFKDYSEVASILLKTENWNALQSVLGLSQKYLKPDSNEFIVFMDKEDVRQPIKNPKKQVYRSKELITFADGKESKDNKMIDIKTGLTYEMVEKKLVNFEVALSDSRISLFHSIVSGFSSLFEKHDQQTTKANTLIYLALKSLQSCKDTKFNKKLFRQCINILSANLKSNVKNLKDLLTFIMTGKSPLKGILNTLMFDEDSFDILFFGFGEEEDQEEDEMKINERLEKEQRIMVSLMGRLEINSFEQDFEVIKILNQAFHFKPGGWIELVKRLTANQTTHQKTSNSHPLVKLVELIDTKKLTTAGQNIEIHNFIKTKPNTNVFTTIFEEIILDTSYNDPDNMGRNSLVALQEILIGIIDMNFRPFFEKLILASEGTENEAKPLSLEKFLVLLHPKKLIQESDIDSLKAFIILATKDLWSFKTHQNYKKVIEHAINQIANPELWTSSENKTRARIAQLLVGSIACDIELILDALVGSNDLKEGQLLRSLYGFLNFSKTSLAQNPDSNENYRNLAQVIVSFAESKHPSKKKVQPTPESETPIESNHPSLNTQELISAIKTNNEANSISLLQYICDSFNNLDNNQTASNQNLCLSIGAGTILADLLQNTNDNALRGAIIFILKISQLLSGSAGDMVTTNQVLLHLDGLINLIKKSFSGLNLENILSCAPDTIKILLLLDASSKSDFESRKRESFIHLKNILDKLEKHSKKELIYSLIKVGFGVDLKADPRSADFERKLDLDERITIYSQEVLPAIFPGIQNNLNRKDFMDIYELSIKLTIDLVRNSKDPRKIRSIVRELIPILERFSICDTKLLEAIISSLEEESDGVENLAGIIAPDMPKDSLGHIAAYIQEASNILHFDLFGKVITSNKRNQGDQQITQKYRRNLDLLNRRLEEQKISTRDLFIFADGEGNNNTGVIGEKEFMALTTRLNINLTEHRVAEAFAKVKLDSGSNDVGNELDDKEFQQAIEYLKEKNALQASKSLRITPEILAGLLLRLVIMLILIYIFVFLGIGAFGAGGTFASIVSSAFPVLGGIALNRGSQQSKEKLEAKNMNYAIQTGFKIVASKDI